jgi:hypothetical protein
MKASSIVVAQTGRMLAVKRLVMVLWQPPNYNSFTIYYHDASGNVTSDGAMMATEASRFEQV